MLICLYIHVDIKKNVVCSVLSSRCNVYLLGDCDRTLDYLVYAGYTYVTINIGYPRLRSQVITTHAAEHPGLPMLTRFMHECYYDCTLSTLTFK